MREILKEWATTIVVLVAAAGAIIGVPVWVEGVVAQEAQAAAEKAVDEGLEKAIAPTVLEMRSMKETMREQLNFDMNEACMKQKPRLRCEREAQYRRATWLYEDCVLNEGGDEAAREKCASVKPEPLEET